MNLEAILNALQVNLNNSREQRDQARYLSTYEKTILKLENWLKQVKDKKLSSEDLKQVKARIKVLNVNSSDIIVDDVGKYIEDFQVHRDDILALLARHEREIKATLHIESSKGIMLRQRSELRRMVLHSREHGVLDSPLSRSPF